MLWESSSHRLVLYGGKLYFFSRGKPGWKATTRLSRGDMLDIAAAMMAFSSKRKNGASSASRFTLRDKQFVSRYVEFRRKRDAEVH